VAGIEKENYKECVRCVMDTTDPYITFDADGVCNECTNAYSELKKQQTVRPVSEMFNTIKKLNSGKEYDGIIGLSGGLDSAYVLHLAMEHGLRPLVVHVDAGWNSDISVSNIRSLVNYYQLDLKTVIIEWEEMRRLQLAFLRSGLMNQDVPQDHAFFSSLYRFASNYGISDVITGENLSTESILPSGWGYGAMDGRQVHAVAKRFEDLKLETYPVLTIPKFYLKHFVMNRLRIHRPLNSISYIKSEAQQELEKLVNWKSYAGKHGESNFTRFHQDVYLTTRFGIDKRRAHLSSLIVSGQMSRADAKSELDSPALSDLDRRNLINFVARKLEISSTQLEEMLHISHRSHRDLPNDEWLMKLANNNNLRRAIRFFTSRK
jgi:N-acetyl sugar amidotransferase